MTDRTGVMLDVVATIDKGLTGGNRRAMAGGTVAIQGDVAGAGMIDGVIIPGPAAMAIRTDRTAAGAAGSVGNEAQIDRTGMTGGAGIMLLVVGTVGKERIING